jgi:mono/diheme cytochrome c family protein
MVGGAAVLFALCAAAAATSSAQEPAAVAAPMATAGASIWTGVYTEEQAKRGEVVSNSLCTGCHGPELSGGEAGPNLVGLEFLGAWNSLTVADFFDRVQSTMPADAPGTMTAQQTSDVTAYVLKLNKYPAGQTDLATDLMALKKITIEGQPPVQ